MNHPELTPEALLQHGAWIQALARRLVQDESRRDDLVQEVWLAALERPPRSGRGLRSWLATVARRKLLDTRRAEQRRERREQIAAQREELPATAELVEIVSAHRRVVEAVLGLEEPYRTTILLRYFREQRPGDIARSLGIPVKTVDTRLRRGLEQLRGRLDDLWNGERRLWCLALIPLAAPAAPPLTAAPAAPAAALPGGLGMNGVASLVLLGAVTAGGLTLWHGLRDTDPAAAPGAAIAAVPSGSGTAAPAASPPFASSQEEVLGDPQGPPRREAATQELLVARDGSGDYDTIGAAVAAASPGAVIRIGPGIYDEPVDLTRPVTLIGAGAEKTMIRSAPGQEVDPAVAARREAATKELSALLDPPLSPEERAHAFELALQAFPEPTLAVRADDVTLEGLRITMLGMTPAGQLRQGAALLLLGDRAVVRHCAVVQSPASGIVITGGDVLVEGCLVAAIQDTGIAVTRWPSEGGVRLVNCDVRDGYHRCITIARDPVLVEGCRISGSSWHGIRYDHVSPTVRGNAFFGNQRFGIYASGKTAAQVTGNLFFDNNVGYSAWFGNQDRVEGNTFVSNPQGGISVVLPSRPEIRRNVLCWSQEGVSFGRTKGDEDTAAATVSATGVMDLNSNLFFRNARNVRELPPDSGAYAVSTTEILEADPGFSDLEGHDFTLVPDSVARAHGIGVPAPPSLTSPWPAMEGEGKTVPLAELTAETPAPRPETGASAGKVALYYGEAFKEGADPAATREALEWLQGALYSPDPVQVHAALQVFLQGGKDHLDLETLRPRLEHLSDTLEGDALGSAFFALYQTGARPGDLERVLRRVDSSSRYLRGSAVNLIAMYSDGRLEGAAADRVLELLNEEDLDAVRDHLGGLWGVHVTPAIEERVLELSETRLSHDAVYFALSTWPDKSEAVLQRLFRAARDPDSNGYGRALWGLQSSIRPEHRATVTRFPFELMSAPRPRPYALDVAVDCVELIGWVAAPSDVAQLEAILADPRTLEVLQESARQAIRRIQRRG